MLIRLAALTVCLSGYLIAQNESSRPRFEVASVKPHDPTLFARMAEIDQAQASFAGHTLFQLVWEAYELQPFQLRAPEWMKGLAFDVSGKLPQGSDRKQVPEMLQALLAERFDLKVHWDSAVQSGYVLTVGHAGVNLLGSQQSGGAARFTMAVDGSSLTGRFATLSDFAAFLTRSLGKVVTYEAADTKRYDMQLDLGKGDLPAPSEPSAMPAAAGLVSSSALSDNLQQRLPSALRRVGLELTVTEQSMRFLVVDSANKSPTGN